MELYKKYKVIFKRPVQLWHGKPEVTEAIVVFFRNRGNELCYKKPDASGGYPWRHFVLWVKSCELILETTGPEVYKTQVLSLKEGKDG